MQLRTWNSFTLADSGAILNTCPDFVSMSCLKALRAGLFGTDNDIFPLLSLMPCLNTPRIGLVGADGASVFELLRASLNWRFGLDPLREFWPDPTVTQNSAAALNITYVNMAV
jgi:hypothetical protein